MWMFWKPVFNSFWSLKAETLYIEVPGECILAFHWKSTNLWMKKLRLKKGERAKSLPRARSFSISPVLCLRFHIPSRGHRFAAGKTCSSIFMHTRKHKHVHSSTHARSGQLPCPEWLLAPGYRCLAHKLRRISIEHSQRVFDGAM